MSILIVDDSSTIRKTIKNILLNEGYSNLIFAESGKETFQKLGLANLDNSRLVKSDIDVILLDIILPDMDGRELCKIIKSIELYKDIPVIMVTSLQSTEDLEKAFEAGAMDYIEKPINSIELLVRTRSAIKLKQEMDKRRLREESLMKMTRGLEKAVKELDKLSSVDGLTGIANRRYFDDYLLSEWQRAKRNSTPISLIMLDIDFFKLYNDNYGHLAGDECLIQVARKVGDVVNRPADLFCRYGGEEFAIILPETKLEGALMLANNICKLVRSLEIEHRTSQIGDFLTISSGVSSLVPDINSSPKILVEAADRALYKAKKQGRNRVVTDIKS